MDALLIQGLRVFLFHSKNKSIYKVTDLGSFLLLGRYSSIDANMTLDAIFLAVGIM